MINHLPRATKTLLIINIAIYLLSLLLQELNLISLIATLASFYPSTANFSLWQPLTHLFMHADFAHLFFNMFALYLFGSAVERILGTKRFLILYFISGIGAYLLYMGQSYWLIHPLEEQVRASGIDLNLIKSHLKLTTMGELKEFYVPTSEPLLQLIERYLTPMVGASGAIYGLLIGYLFFFPRAKLFLIFLPVPIEARFFIPLLLLLEFLLGLFEVSWLPIAYFAHLGGAASGAMLLLYWRFKGQNKRNYRPF